MDPLEVETVHLNRLENAEEHHTKRFELLHAEVPTATILRRGQPFKGFIRFYNRTFDPAIDTVQFVFSLGDKPARSTQGASFLQQKHKNDDTSWSVKIIDIQENVVNFEVVTPINVPIGSWVLQVVTKVVNDDNRRTYDYNGQLFILFNPWNGGDPVYMEETHLLDEYIQSDVGKIFAGTVKSAKGRPWVFGQFDAIVLPTCFFMLDRANLSFESRGDPVKVARAISRITNSNDEDGVVYGGWSGEYGDGTAPSAWTGSVDILKQYYETLTAVRYGQCWVFAGVVTTVCRALGIPSRVVTNFESAHDINESLSLDKYYSETMEEISSEGIWNFHVWNDVWMARHDLPPGYGGWQAIDATPQEMSLGVFQCGPASVEAVKQGVIGLVHDVPFLLSSVNADLMRWKKDPDAEDGYVKIETDQFHIGQLILTKKPLVLDPIEDSDKEDITHLYKYTEGTEAERIALYNGVRHYNTPNATKSYAMTETPISDVKLELVDVKSVNMGEDFVVVVKIKNNSDEPRNVKAVLRATSYFYNGVKARLIKENEGGLEVGPNREEELALMVESSDYMDKLVERSHVKIAAIVSVQETKQIWASDDTLQIIKPRITIKINEDVIREQQVTAVLSFNNVLNTPLTGCEFRLGGSGLQTVIVKVPDVEPCDMVTGDVPITFNRSGVTNLVATFDSNELKDVTGESSVAVNDS